MNEKQSLETFLEQKKYDFEAIEPVFPCIGELETVQQDAVWHGEGNVLEHTRRVCQAVTDGTEWLDMSRRDRTILYMAALFHDIGKKDCTTEEEGRVISPNHSIVGMRRFREYCYREMEDRFEIPFNMREEIAWLIRYHGLPLLFLEKEPLEYHLVRAAESVRIRLLYQLGRADVLGRECADRESALDTVEYFRAYAKETGCYDGRISFANDYTRFAYFHKRDLWTGDHLYDPTEFDMYVMSGLPLAGKDTYIGQELQGIPVVSLDDIRSELGIRPDEPSGPVAAVAKERAKAFLRNKTPFVWNATNVLLDTRQKVCQLGLDYGARVNLIYREAPYIELLKRNQIRERSVPVEVIHHLIRKLYVPECVETYRVVYPDMDERSWRRNNTMVFSINKQAVEIKTRFENAPLTSPNEACASIGMLYKIYGLPIPEKREMVSQMREDLHQAISGKPAPTEFAEKVMSLLDGYFKDDPVTDEIYELLQYSYSEQK